MPDDLSTREAQKRLTQAIRKNKILRLIRDVELENDAFAPKEGEVFKFTREQLNGLVEELLNIVEDEVSKTQKEELPNAIIN